MQWPLLIKQLGCSLCGKLRKIVGGIINGPRKALVNYHYKKTLGYSKHLKHNEQIGVLHRTDNCTKLVQLSVVSSEPPLLPSLLWRWHFYGAISQSGSTMPCGRALRGRLRRVTFSPLPSQILATPSFSTSSIRMSECRGI